MFHGFYSSFVNLGLRKISAERASVLRADRTIVRHPTPSGQPRIVWRIERFRSCSLLGVSPVGGPRSRCWKTIPGVNLSSSSQGKTGPSRVPSCLPRKKQCRLTMTSAIWHPCVLRGTWGSLVLGFCRQKRYRSSAILVTFRNKCCSMNPVPNHEDSQSASAAELGVFTTAGIAYARIHSESM